jgi:hypothetical protein
VQLTRLWVLEVKSMSLRVFLKFTCASSTFRCARRCLIKTAKFRCILPKWVRNADYDNFELNIHLLQRSIANLASQSGIPYWKLSIGTLQKA